MSETKRKRPISRKKAYEKALKVKAIKKAKKEVVKQSKFYAADFEATVELMSIIDYKNKNSYIDTDRIVVTWAGLQSCETMKQQTFQTRYKGNQYIDALDSFMNTVKRLEDNSTIVFHNLKGYDHGPIIHWCLSNNYKISGNLGDFRVRFGPEKVIRFFDSLNLIVSSISKLAPLVGLSKGGKYEIETPLVSHFDKNTTTIRVENAFSKEYEYHTFEMSLDKAFKAFEWDLYANEDINILAHVINHFKLPLLLHNRINTQANFAWQTLHNADYNSEDPVYSWLTPLDKLPKENFKFKKDEGTALINKILKNTYKGGLTYVNPKYQAVLDENGEASINGHVVENTILEGKGYTYDINSMYPWIYSTMKLPVARSHARLQFKVNPVKTDKAHKDYSVDTPRVIEELKAKLNEPDVDLGFATIIKLKATLKEDCTMPFLKLKTQDKETFMNFEKAGLKNNKNSYLRKFDATAHITLEELRYLLETYDIESFQSCDLYLHRADEYLMDKFKKHCDYWYKIKQTTKDPAEKFMAKLMLNAAYGKVAQYTKDLTSYKYKFENGQLVLEPYKKPAGYESANVAAGAYITAYGRVQLSKWINKIGDKFIYCDTDSLHVWDGLDYSQIFEIDNNKLGALKLEMIFSKGSWIAPKTYAEYGYEHGSNSKSNWVMHIAGSNIPIKIEEFSPNNKIPVTRSKNVKGGRLIVKQYQHLPTGQNIKLNVTKKADFMAKRLAAKEAAKAKLNKK